MTAAAGPRLGSLSRATGRGFFITFGFDAVLQVVVLVQSLLVPRLLGPSAIGLYALAMAVVSVGFAVKELGTHERLIQEREVPLPLAYSVAFTLEITVASALLLVVLAIAPVVAAVYDRSELIPIIAVMAVTIYTNAFLNLPGALHLRNLNYARQNVLASVRPLVGFAVTVPLAFAGAGVWSLVAGAIAALFVACLVVAWGAPLRPRLRFDRAVLGRYIHYGWPLWVSNLLSLSTTWAGAFAISWAVGVAGLGFFTVANSLAQRAFRLDLVLAKAIFPALARAQDDLQGQLRAFVATNRVTVMWAGPMGFGLAVFAPDLVHLVLGDRWEPGIFLFRMQGLAVTVGSIGYSWDAFFRARGETRPTLVFNAISEAWVFVVLLPAVLLFGLTGAAWAIASLGVISIFARQIMIRRLFPGINLVANAWRELLATAAAAAAVAGLRELVGPPTTLVTFAAFLVLFGLLSVAAIVAIDHSFLRDLLRRLRRRRGRADAPAAGTEAGRQALGRAVALDVALPGSHPTKVAVVRGQVWVVLRDSSAVARYDRAGAGWETLRLPAYPTDLAVDARGRIAVPLAIARSVAVIDGGPASIRRRIPGSSDLAAAAWTDGELLVVDRSRRSLWRLRDAGIDSIALPDDAGRPEAVASADGAAWVTTDSTSLLRISREGTVTAIAAGGPTGSVVATAEGVWAARLDEPRVVCARAPEGPVAGHELPGPVAGLAVGDDGTVWAAIPSEDVVIAVGSSGPGERVALPAGTAPVALAWHDEGLYVVGTGRDRLLWVR